MAQFSGAVRIGDLNDFIAPSQACVVNVDGTPKEEKLVPKVLAKAPGVPGFAQTVRDAESDAIKVTLQDCLACSGCITSAETVLLQHQSTEELMQKLQDPSVTVIATLSPQSRASLAEAHKIGLAECDQRIVGFLKSLGVRWVVDAHVARGITLRETAAEFVSRYRHSHANAVNTAHTTGEQSNCPPTTQDGHLAETLASPHTSGAAGNECQSELDTRFLGDAADQSASGRDADVGPLPMLSSACPGWICYAEKTHGEHVLPYISTAKSPQAVAGTLVKRHFCGLHDLPPESVYHAAIMPCYDKKLEASRDDFNLTDGVTPETDSVLTTGEVHELLVSRGVSLAAVERREMDPIAAGAAVGEGKIYGVRGGSGGYLEYVLRTASRQLFHLDIGDGALQLKRVRNDDFQEVTIERDGQPLLRGASAYGFRNIQNLMRKLKMKQCKYDFIEIMACPSGCLNGGGQIKVEGGQSAVQAHIAQLEAVYHDPSDVILQWPEDDSQVTHIYENVLHSEPFSPGCRKLLHTGYHHRKKTVQASVLDW